MLKVGIRDLKNNLSKYLLKVKEGESIYITEHGKTIARIAKEPGGKRSLDELLTPLVRDGTVIRAGKTRRHKGWKPIRTKGKPLSEIVKEDRR